MCGTAILNKEESYKQLLNFYVRIQFLPMCFFISNAQCKMQVKNYKKNAGFGGAGVRQGSEMLCQSDPGTLPTLEFGQVWVNLLKCNNSI